MMRTLMTCLLLALSLAAQAELRIFACEPEWGALARELAGDEANLYVATTAQQDPHYIQARPSLLARVRRADLLVCNGADLEVGWLPVLLQRAGNPAVRPGQPGHFLAAEQVTLLDIPASLDRSEGDVHPAGNPHIHLDPQRVLQVAAALSSRMQQVDPEHAAAYRQRLASFQTKWRAATTEWLRRAARLAGLRVVVGHTEWRYLQAWTGLEVVATLEAKPGIPPSSSHLGQVLRVVELEQPQAALTAPGRSTRGMEWLSKRSGLPTLMLPYTIGGTDAATDLFALFDDTLTRLEGLRQ